MRYMLDTNTTSYIIKGNPPMVRKKLAAQPMNSIVISAVTQGELLYGVARKGHPPALVRLVHEFLCCVNILPWDDDTARIYADMRANCTSAGITVSALDMMIAAHSVASQSVLVTHDQIFKRIIDQRFVVEDWVTR
jgi:tRNA(fMet)-specific endonuclease VapC